MAARFFAGPLRALLARGVRFVARVPVRPLDRVVGCFFIARSIGPHVGEYAPRAAPGVDRPGMPPVETPAPPRATLVPRAPGADRAAFDAIRLPHDRGVGTNAGDSPMVPIIIEGADPPWLLERVWRTTPALPDGYHPWIAVVARDEEGWRRACERTDLAPILADERVHVFTGERAALDFSEFQHERLHTRLNCQLLTLPGAPDGTMSPLPDLIRAALGAQQAEHVRLTAEVEAIYAGRDERFWAERFRAAMESAPGAAPLRVLILTSRYTTFVRHAMHDLAEAFRAGGCEARTLMEPDDHSRLVTVAYLREFAAFRPDLVVTANFARPHLGAACPRNVPFVCWIQDTLAHLFDSRIGRALGPLDFTFGNTMQALHLHHGWPARTMRHWPVVASAARFHAGPVDAARRQRFECDLAYVSHHSGAPEALTQGWLRETRPGSPEHEAVRWLAPRLIGLVRDEAPGAPLDERQHSARARPIIDEALAMFPGATLDRSRFWAHVAGPMMERLVRRQTLRWAAEAARSRGLVFRIYGRGWDADPEFAPFAAGPVEPGEDLRACYQCAGAHLHMSANTGAHQRVYECALSGGLMLRRLCLADLEMYEEELARRSLAAPPGGAAGAGRGPVTLAGRDIPGMGALNRWRASVGLPARRSMALDADHASRLLARAPVSMDLFPDRLLPDSAETLFWSAETLAERVERAADPAWRRRTQEAHARAIAGHATTDALARDMACFVREALGGSQGPG